MSYQVKKKGGSVTMVKIDSVDGQQRESYVGAIEPYTTEKRLHELQTFNRRHVKSSWGLDAYFLLEE